MIGFVRNQFRKHMDSSSAPRVRQAFNEPWLYSLGPLQNGQIGHSFGDLMIWHECFACLQEEAHGSDRDPEED